MAEFPESPSASKITVKRKGDLPKMTLDRSKSNTEYNTFYGRSNGRTIYITHRRGTKEYRWVVEKKGERDRQGISGSFAEARRDATDKARKGD